MARRGDKYWLHSFEARDSFRDRQGAPRRVYTPPPPVTREPAQGKPAELPKPRGLPPGSCAGPCNARARKAMETLDAYDAAVRAWEENPVGGPPAEPEGVEVRPWPGDPVFCGRCAAIIRKELAELDDLAAIRLARADGHRSGPGGERVGGSRGTPSPSPSVDDVDEMASALRGWEAVARGQDDTPPRRGFLAQEVTTVVAWLVAHLDQILANGDYAADFATEVRQWHRRLRQAEKAGTGRHHLPVPCPRCGEKSLEAEDGADYVECMNRSFGNRECGRLLSRGDYEAEAQAWLARRGAPKPPAA